jgi:hypothetical protein
MSIISDDKLSNGGNATDDNYYKVNNDTILLMVRLTFTHRKTDEIAKRLKKLDDEDKNPNNWSRGLELFE